MKVATSMSVGRLAPKHTLNIDGIRKLSKNENSQLIKDNVVLRDNLHGRTIEEYTNDIFQPFIDAYNKKQRRKDRQIQTGYCEWHRSKMFCKIFVRLTMYLIKYNFLTVQRIP